ncbi:MAG: helix-turn-helix domain-containing protein [Pannonibacter sp.]
MTKSLHTPEYTALLRTLIETRKRSGMTQHEVADRLGKPQSYIAKVEGGERRLDVVEFVMLAKAMDENPIELFDRLLTALDDMPISRVQ